MPRRTDYKGFVLSSEARIETDMRWRPVVLIVRYHAQEAHERMLEGADTVETRDMADTLSIEMGKRWIDGHPDPFAG